MTRVGVELLGVNAVEVAGAGIGPTGLTSILKPPLHGLGTGPDQMPELAVGQSFLVHRALWCMARMHASTASEISA